MLFRSILDEPNIGLDPRQIREIRHLIKGFSKNRTVILSTHILPEVSQICDRVIIINKGSIVAEDSPSNLTSSAGKSSKTQLVVRAAAPAVRTLLSTLPAVHYVRCHEDSSVGSTTATCETDPDAEIRPALARAVIEKGWDLLELRPILVSLEDVFIDLVTQEAEEEVPAADEGRKEVAS